MTAKRCTSGRSSRTAFTIVELVIVVLIIGIMAAIGVPRFNDAVEYHRTATAATRVKLDLELARNRARMASAVQEVVFDTADNIYSLTGVAGLDHSSATYQVDLSHAPYEATLASVDFGGSETVQFNGFGIPNSAGEVSVQVGSYVRTVQLDATGTATVQ